MRPDCGECFGHWNLFEPSLARLIWCISISVSGLEVEALNTSGVNSVWARDLVFGAWNFHDFHKADNFLNISQLLV